MLSVSSQRQRYGIENIGTSHNVGTSCNAKLVHDLRITTPYGDEEYDIVGFADDAQSLEARLYNQEPRRSIISILGMGGLGKTTLARKLYNNNKTKFGLYAWVCVSQEWNTRDLLERLIKSFKELDIEERDKLEKMKDYEVEPYLHQILEKHRYLVVVDDVWHREAWESLRKALPDKETRSRIIITTRNENVAAISDQRTYVHKLRFLRPDDEMKPCFLYLNLFPEDSIIEVEKLIHLWVAEQLLPNWSEGYDAEDIAHCNLKELVRRNLIQTVANNWRTITHFRVHDLVRDLAVNKAKEYNFPHINDGRNSNNATMTASRRIAFHFGFDRYMSIDHSHQRLRTIYLINEHIDARYRRCCGDVLHLRFRLLRVLDIEGAVVRTDEGLLRFFEGICELVHLRYLGLPECYINELSETIGQLQALQTLKVQEIGDHIRLPKSICKLKQLRHLIGTFKICEKGMDAMTLFTELINLQTINRVEMYSQEGVNENDNNGLKAFSTLENLRHLSVFMVAEKISNWVSLEPLLICKKLVHLSLTGLGGKIPEDIHISLTMLQYLKLHAYEFEEDPLPALEKLPKFLVLDVKYHASEATTWTSNAKGFPQLEDLKFSYRSNVTLQIDEEAMPRLRFFSFNKVKHYGYKYPVLYVNVAKESVIPERFRSLPERPLQVKRT